MQQKIIKNNKKWIMQKIRKLENYLIISSKRFLYFMRDYFNIILIKHSVLYPFCNIKKMMIHNLLLIAVKLPASLVNSDENSSEPSEVIPWNHLNFTLMRGFNGFTLVNRPESHHDSLQKSKPLNYSAHENP